MLKVWTRKRSKEVEHAAVKDPAKASTLYLIQDFMTPIS